jgi:exopolysaccharide biosynthesis polyprenyl glycosylphosphotransferase
MTRFLPDAPPLPADADVRSGPAAVPERPAGDGQALTGGRYGRLGPGAAVRLADVLALLADVVALLAAAAIAGAHSWRGALYIAAVLSAAALIGLHRVRICLRVVDQAGRIAVVAALPALLILPWTPSADALRLAGWSAGLLLAFRIAGSAGLRAAHRRGLLTEPTLVVGTGEVGQHVARLLAAHPELGLRPAGFLDSHPAAGPLALPVLGRLTELRAVVTQHRIRRVIVCFAGDRDQHLVPVLRASRPLNADICLVPRLHELGAAVPRGCLDEVWGIPLIPLRQGPAAVGAFSKRAFDLTAATVLLILAAPLLLVLAGAVRWQLRRPALFRQVRVVGPGRLAEIAKLRTLGLHSNPDTCWSAPAQQCTGLGRFLRATHLDELPQLVNVLRGEMSLVGPRPERPYFATQFGHDVPGYHDRNRVRAGLTGWAQVHGLNGDTSIHDRARFDNAYIENWSFWLDLTILARTVASTVATAAGALAGPRRGAAGRYRAAGLSITEPTGPCAQVAHPQHALSAYSSLGGSR